MNIIWLAVGMVLGVGGTYMIMSQRARLRPMDYVQLVILAGLLIFTVAYVSTVAVEPQLGASRATAVGALLFGGATVVYGVLLGRKIYGTLN